MDMAFIFDVEGTLVDSARQQLTCLHETLMARGRAVPIRTLQQYLGMDGDDMLRIIAPEWDEKNRKTALKQQGERYEREFLPTVTAVPQIRASLKGLKSRGYRLALATDCKGAPLKHYRSLMRIDDLIDAIACGEDVEEGKPGSDLVKTAVQKLHITAGASFMVGDTPYDAAAAIGCGSGSVGVLTGGFRAHRLLAGGCLDVLRTISALPGWTEGAPFRHVAYNVARHATTT